MSVMDMVVLMGIFFLAPILLSGEAFALNESLVKTFSHDPGGHIQAEGDWYHDKDNMLLFREGNGDDTALSGYVRLFDRIRIGASLDGEIHYEAVAFGGEYYRHLARLAHDAAFPSIDPSFSVSDHTRLFNLTRVIDENADYLVYHRLDRLFIRRAWMWGDLSLGRQAVTWGNGLMFNPMDLFNPFSPSDTNRDYKIGDDLVSLRITPPVVSEIQLLWVPRRDPDTGKVNEDRSSVGGKVHGFWGNLEVDAMAARHYEDAVLGGGVSGYLKKAAWRMDGVWVFSSANSYPDGYGELVINMDYSWVLLGKNMYGLAEYFFSGVGEEAPEKVLGCEPLMDRLARGDLFVTGRHYAGGMIQVEWHPLVTLAVSLIHNLGDGSGIVQPRINWNATQNSRVIVGLDTAYGGHGTEFGGFTVPGLGDAGGFPTRMFLQASFYF